MHRSKESTVVVDNVRKDFYLTKSGSNIGIRIKKRGKVVHALKPVSFAVGEGECVGIIGRNGSGKSTLLNIISGDLAATSGHVYVSAQPTRIGISSVLQPHLTGEANINLGLLAMGLSVDEVAELTPKILEWTELTSAASRPMSTYSSGMKSRLKFGISTAVPREIMIVDEALSAGDSTFTEKAEKRLDEFLEVAGTVFIVSHSISTIDRLCNRAIWIHDGEVLNDGDPYYISRFYQSWSRHASAGNLSDAEWVLEDQRKQYHPPEIIFDKTDVNGPFN